MAGTNPVLVSTLMYDSVGNTLTYADNNAYDMLAACCEITNIEELDETVLSFSITASACSGFYPSIGHWTAGNGTFALSITSSLFWEWVSGTNKITFEFIDCIPWLRFYHYYDSNNGFEFYYIRGIWEGKTYYWDRVNSTWIGSLTYNDIVYDRYSDASAKATQLGYDYPDYTITILPVSQSSGWDGFYPDWHDIGNYTGPSNTFFTDMVFWNSLCEFSPSVLTWT